MTLPLLRLFVPDEAAIEVGYLRMGYVVNFYFVQGLGGCAASAMPTFGKTTLVMSSTLLFTLGIRYAWIKANNALQNNTVTKDRAFVTVLFSK